MNTKEIIRNEWAGFFEMFSKQHEGWLASLEIFGDDVAAQTEAVELPFEGISFDAEAESLLISFGKTAADHISHTVERPRRVWLRQTPEGADDSLEIEEHGTQKTLLRFRAAVRPEFVDGIV